tara:strand:+ start:2676 stop:3221 length:546 start_codon:yes stop_codon:yes gene_type:complete
MRGYFGIGVEGLSKPMNAGNLYRSAHAFGASFVFTVAANYQENIRKSDTSNTKNQIPFYEFDNINTINLPRECVLVGVEITEEATELPSFCHPRCAAYILGMERGSLSSGTMELCHHIVRIPTQFSLNVATAGAVIMYDRMLSCRRFGARPTSPNGPIEPVPKPFFGPPRKRKQNEKIGNN